jgi:signal transduction histidine kinase
MGDSCPSGRSRNGEPPRIAGFGDEAGQVVLSASADGIVAIDENGCIRVCNPAAEKLFERSAGELVGSKFGFPIAGSKTTEIELMVPGGGTRVVEMRVSTTILDNEHLYVAVLRDVTHRRQEAEELEAALDRGHSMVAVASHELRNPLATIAVLAETLRDPLAALSDDEKKAIAGRIADRVTYLQALARKFLTASKIEARPQHARPRCVPVLELILERLAEFDGRSEDVHVSCRPDLTAYVDRGEFSEMIANCLENAFLHGFPPIKVTAIEDHGWVVVRVHDSGPGVPREFVPRLFERFSRAPGAEQNAEGSGLGLWIVRSLAQANGGDAVYEPGRDGGACFCLRLREAEPA